MQIPASGQFPGPSSGSRAPRYHTLQTASEPYPPSRQNPNFQRICSSRSSPYGLKAATNGGGDIMSQSLRDNQTPALVYHRVQIRGSIKKITHSTGFYKSNKT